MYWSFFAAGSNNLYSCMLEEDSLATVSCVAVLLSLICFGHSHVIALHVALSLLAV